jgi:hypothetical protein
VELLNFDRSCFCSVTLTDRWRSFLGPCRNEEKEREKRKARRGGFAAVQETELAERNDDRILEMMRSFSFVQATEEDFLEGMPVSPAFDHVAARDEEPEQVPEPEPYAPSPAPTFSFKFQHQMPETPGETAVVSRELPFQDVEVHEPPEEKVPSLPLETETEFNHEHEDEAEETEQEQRRGVLEPASSQVVAATHSYRFLTERDFRGFIREPESMTVRLEESLVQQGERRVVEVAPRGGAFLTETDFTPADEPDVCDSIASLGKRTPSRNRKPASSPSHVRESVALSGKRAPSRTRKPARSPSVASRGSAVGGRTSFASEFSGFGDSDSESSASDGYSVKDLVVDSDSEWFLSDKDFPGATRDAGARKSYEAKVLKAIEALEEAAKLDHSYQDQDSATTLSPTSVRQGSPESIPDGSVKYPEDMWSRSPLPDVEYKDDEVKVATEAAEAEERNLEEEESFDMSDDEHSSSGNKLALAPVGDAASVAEKRFDHSEKETITVTDHSGEAVSDVQTSPEAVSERGFAASSDQVDDPDSRRSPGSSEALFDVQRSPAADSERGFDVSSNQIDSPDAKRTPEPSVHEFVGTIDHSLHNISYDRKETASESDQSYEIVFYDKRRPEPLDTGFVGASDQSHELISDVWKEIASKNDHPCSVDFSDKGGLDPADKEFASVNDHSSELIANNRSKKVTFGIDDECIPGTTEQEFGADDHTSYGIVPGAKYNLEYGKEEEQASANNHSDNFAPQSYVSVTGKAKMYEDDGEDPEVKWKDLTDEEEDELESLWEHQDLIEQLKLELKKVRSIGLPTIMEESETPKAPMEDLKPWRMDAKFLREDPMDELNKFYKSYRERMRKFDILCYQKMYAIGMLQIISSILFT